MCGTAGGSPGPCSGVGWQAWAGLPSDMPAVSALLCHVHWHRQQRLQALWYHPHVPSHLQQPAGITWDALMLSFCLLTPACTLYPPALS
jgi:hypothetical protein